MIVGQILIAALAACALATWLVGLLAMIRATRHRTPGVSTFYLMSHGIAFFTGGELFTPLATPHLRRFRIAAAAFAGLVALMIVVALLAFDVYVGAGATP